MLVVRPTRTVLAATAVLTLVSLWLELPVTGNHWLVVGFIAVATLLSMTRDDPWAWLSVTGRWILLGFYSFAAFAKLNTGFLDPQVSCGVFYANQSLASFGLPTFDGNSVLGTVAIAGPVLIELSVPILLAFTRTRLAGVLLALVFHTVISLDFSQHFYDFTAALVVLLCLFLPQSTLERLDVGIHDSPRLKVALVTVASIVVTASLLPPVPTAFATVKLIGFGAWVLVAAWIIWQVARDGLGPAPLPMRIPGSVASALVALVVANGMAPYLELKTAVGFNMYANLTTVAGETNHLLVPGTLHLRDVQDDLLTVVRSDAEELDIYAREGYLVPEPNLQDYLARHPGVSVVVAEGSGERTLDEDEAVELPLLVRKFLTFRAVDSQDPPRCQSAWLPAY
ncbi:hypothetical protein GCM10011376_18930 [Nocardioides flavus (ex Wang et al. 2016)]|uniref:Arabinofuranosyltransferase n=1 Tax=Nocardioides flavus (ex Wang et al. 2016) TaxID=2058780 RepID=A0ABQ3HK50_9ACTN|nr:hypothetical protein GCM10011376_18930 [Nocardioides flavus (ex Wang et al. 2016)]